MCVPFLCRLFYFYLFCRAYVLTVCQNCARVASQNRSHILHRLIFLFFFQIVPLIPPDSPPSSLPSVRYPRMCMCERFIQRALTPFPGPGLLSATRAFFLSCFSGHFAVFQDSLIQALRREKEKYPSHYWRV